MSLKEWVKVRKPFLLAAASALIFLTFALSACSSASTQLPEQPTTQNNQNLDLDQIKNERLRLEQELSDYHNQLEQILQNLSESS
jgi:peptidoglycan hydrolase CwlO-like protein